MKFFILIATFLLIMNLPVVGASDFSAEKAGFAVKFKDAISPYKVIGVYVLPAEKLTLEAVDQNKSNHYITQAAGGEVTQLGPNKWQWLAPKEIGFYPVQILNSKLPDSVTLNIFVMIPFEQLKSEYLNGYRIGRYANIPFRNLPIYRLPRGFIEVTKENEKTLISPHFELWQFLSKQSSGYPKYLVLKERLLLKLELILEKMNEKGFRCDAFHIMSGYRTPYYNQAIGNVKYSRHLWGGAADVFIDENPKDGMMDDINKDGKIDFQDALIIYEIIDEMYGKSFYELFVGGLGLYKKTANHGPFVHVDVRGFRARWGY